MHFSLRRGQQLPCEQHSSWPVEHYSCIGIFLVLRGLAVRAVSVRGDSPRSLCGSKCRALWRFKRVGVGREQERAVCKRGVRKRAVRKRTLRKREPMALPLAWLIFVQDLHTCTSLDAPGADILTSYLKKPDAARFLRVVLTETLAKPSGVIFAPEIAEHLRDVHEVHVNLDAHGRFEMTQTMIIDVFGGRKVRESSTAYLSRMREDGQALELDMLIALALTYGVGVQVYQPYQQEIFPFGGVPRMSDVLYQLMFLIPPQSPANASLIFLYTPARLRGMVGHYEPMRFLPEFIIRNKLTALKRQELKSEMELFHGTVDRDRAQHLLKIKPEDMIVPSVLRKDKKLYLAELQRHEQTFRFRLPSPERVIALPYTSPNPNPTAVDLVSEPEHEDDAFLDKLDAIEAAYFRSDAPDSFDANGDSEEQEIGSDVDSSGNLAGFVCADSVGDSESSFESSSDSARSGLSVHSRQRRHLKKELAILKNTAHSCRPRQPRRRGLTKISVGKSSLTKRSGDTSSPGPPGAPKKQKVVRRLRLTQASSSSEHSEPEEAFGRRRVPEAADSFVPTLRAGLVELQGLLRSISADMVVFKHELEQSVLSSPAASAALTVSAVASPSSPAAGLQELASPNILQAEFTEVAIVWQQLQQQPSSALLEVEELTSEDTEIFEARVRARRAANPVQQFPPRRSSRQRRSSFRVDV